MSEEITRIEFQTTELTAVREVVLQANPECVPELVRGESVAELLASVDAAKAAYARVVERLPVREENQQVPPVVPAGGGNAVIDPGDLPAAEKVRRGIAIRR